MTVGALLEILLTLPVDYRIDIDCDAYCETAALEVFEDKEYASLYGSW